jgi:hypothetical protein
MGGVTGLEITDTAIEEQEDQQPAAVLALR